MASMTTKPTHNNSNNKQTNKQTNKQNKKELGEGALLRSFKNMFTPVDTETAYPIGDYRVAFHLCFKASPGAKSFI